MTGNANNLSSYYDVPLIGPTSGGVHSTSAQNLEPVALRSGSQLSAGLKQGSTFVQIKG